MLNSFLQLNLTNKPFSTLYIYELQQFIESSPVTQNLKEACFRAGIVNFALSKTARGIDFTRMVSISQSMQASQLLLSSHQKQRLHNLKKVFEKGDMKAIQYFTKSNAGNSPKNERFSCVDK